MIHNAEVSMKRADNGQMDAQDFYQINTKSAACPMGFDQEETAKRLWATGHTLRELSLIHISMNPTQYLPAKN